MVALSGLPPPLFAPVELPPLFAQAIMYGLYVGTSVYCVRWLLFDDKDWKIRKTINWSMLTIGIILSILMTINHLIALQSTAFSLEAWWIPVVDVRWSPK